ncbi:O-antigen ligase family protein [Hydrogenimonas urashimensis]|uniref:O-antigen ligase family protein n=1 Tax=Hydrogenimonas urashimensis TaxID=2740515 RepID=UPI001915397C|nr:O-antigen ligase family protein [Hydrogenimonas urashimensis]
MQYNDRLKKRISFLLNLFLVVYAALLPFSYAFTIYTGPLLLVFLWLAEGELHQKTKALISNKALLFLLLFFAVHMLSVLWSDNIHAAMRILKHYFAIIVLMVVMYTSLKKSFVPYLLLTFLFSMFVSEILLYGVFFEWWHFKKASVANPSPIMHHVFYSIFVAVTSLLLLWQLFNPKNPLKIKILEFFFLISTTTNLFLNSGRTGQLGFIFALFVFTIKFAGFKKKYLLGTLSALLALFLSAYQFSPIFHAKVHQGISDVRGIFHGNLDTSWGLRVAMKKVGIRIVKDHPLLGVGVGDVIETFQSYLEKSKEKKYSFLSTITHVHDQWLQITLQTGIVGLILFVLSLVQLYKMPFHAPLIQATFHAILTIFIVAFFTDVPLRNFTAALFGFTVGLFLFLSRTYSTLEESYS